MNLQVGRTYKTRCGYRVEITRVMNSAYIGEYYGADPKLKSTQWWDASGKVIGAGPNSAMTLTRECL